MSVRCLLPDVVSAACEDRETTPGGKHCRHAARRHARGESRHEPPLRHSGDSTTSATRLRSAVRGGSKCAAPGHRCVDAVFLRSPGAPTSQDILQGSRQLKIFPSCSVRCMPKDRWGRCCIVHPGGNLRRVRKTTALYPGESDFVNVVTVCVATPANAEWLRRRPPPTLEIKEPGNAQSIRRKHHA